MIKENTKRNIWVALGIIMVIAIVIMMTSGCISEPKKKDYDKRPNACYDFAECLYLNQKNNDKSVCLPISMECRAYEKYTYCKSEKEMTFNNCWLYLNQK